jgi:hypothetical protein
LNKQFSRFVRELFLNNLQPTKCNNRKTGNL